MSDGQTLRPGGSPLASAPRERGAAASVGLLVDGRYRLVQRRSWGESSSTWDGRDDQLHRAVHVRVVTGPTAADAVDAARRAAAIEDSRLTRVLDVGTETAADGSALGWVISEQPPGRLLVDLLREAPLAAARARALVGEAASVLARASASGLHHRRLDPSSVALSPEGAVTVLGLEVAAASAGLPPVPAAQAEREDAVALVALLHAGLTGLWPLGPSAGLDAAPLAGGVPVPPADLVPGVPEDLDALVAATLGPSADGPRSPGELVQELAPWGSTSGPVTASGRTLPRSTTRQPPVPTVPTVPTAPAPTAAVPPVTAPAPVPRAAAAEGGLDAFDALIGPPRRGRRRAADPAPVAGSATAATASTAPSAPSAPSADEQAPPLHRGAGRAVLAVVALVVVGLLALAVTNLPRIGGAVGLAPSSAPAPPAAGAPAGTGTSAPPAPPTTGPPLGVVTARALDPLGDGSENDAQAGRAVDGDPASAWSTSTYRTAALGGLKTGVGLALDLGRDAAVSSLDLGVAGTGGTVEVRSSPTGGYAGSTVLATAGVGSGSGEPVVVRLPQPVTTRWVVLWFTALPRVDGGFRADVAEVAVH